LAGKSDGKRSSDECCAYMTNKVPYTGLVLGIDPSLRGMGLALVEFDRGKGICVETKTLKLAQKLSMADCLGEISRNVTLFLEKGDVRHVALEQTIYVQNFQTAQILGAARGAAIAAAAVRRLPVFEYMPLRVKQAVVGYGRASKEQVAKMVCQHLSFECPLPPDEADAASVAICHAFTYVDEGV